MSESEQNNLPQEFSNLLGGSGISRKDFLKYAGTAGAAVATMGLIGCDDEDGPGPDPEPEAVFLGEGDFAVLNYAYALEQLEAAFYIQVLDNFYGDGDDAPILEDVRDHEIAHRDFYAAALGDNAIPGLTVDFSTVDFSSRENVLTVALTFENVGVSAYNGAGALLENPDFLLVAGKIVSVEARHSAAISDLIRPMIGVAGNQLAGSGPIIDDNGLDLARSPQEVLEIAGPFIEETFDTSGLPQS